MDIIVLDDHPEDIRPLLKAIFQGDTLTFVTMPYEALTKLSSEKFDLMFLDGDLGAGGNGPDVLLGWKTAGLALPPIAMFSADEKYRRQGLEAGALCAIDKADCDFAAFEELKRRVSANYSGQPG